MYAIKCYSDEHQYYLMKGVKKGLMHKTWTHWFSKEKCLYRTKTAAKAALTNVLKNDKRCAILYKAQNTHAFGVCRRVQVKLMEADVEGSRGQKQK